MIITQWRK